jgi:HEAT repeat protein
MAESYENSAPPGPEDDPRPVDELIAFLLGGPDEDPYWDAVGALHRRGTREVLDRAVGLCRSPCAVERRVGADILAQLGVPERAFPEAGLHILLPMLAVERDPAVLRSILVALSHYRCLEAIVPASRLRHHDDPEVRFAVVFALMCHEDSQAFDTLAELTRDPEADVRDWATFALGTRVEADTPGLREALVERLADPDDDTRAEAMVGLARRGDRRVLPALREELASDSVGTLAVEAAALIGEPDLYPLLVALRGWWVLDAESLAEAIRACSPRPGLAT